MLSPQTTRFVKHPAAYRLSHPHAQLQGRVPLVASKSESNRALVIAALAGNRQGLENLSAARDTQTMLQLLSQPDAPEWDVLDAGTTMRFLTAYAAIKGYQKTLTGTPRMQQRPIGILTDALRQLGAQITFLKEEGYPPLRIEGFQYSGQKHLQVRGDISSQYISALLMVAPYLPEGLELELTGKVGSQPYIRMTLGLMSHFGARYQWEDNRISVAPQPYQTQNYCVESDWSGASYWFSMAALSQTAEIELGGLKAHSLQGDSVLTDITRGLGVESDFSGEGLLLRKTQARIQSPIIDFTHCPDLAQTLAVMAAAQNIPLELRGLESLRIKETDRIFALQEQLAKFGVQMSGEGGTFQLSGSFCFQPDTTIQTYEDHRMAMAFAPLALFGPVCIEDPGVVAKSYPAFWEDLQQLGFEMEPLS